MPAVKLAPKRSPHDCFRLSFAFGLKQKQNFIELLLCTFGLVISVVALTCLGRLAVP